MIIFGPAMLNFYEQPSIGMKTFPTGIDSTEDMKGAGGIQPNKITYRSRDQKLGVLGMIRDSQAWLLRGKGLYYGMRITILGGETHISNYVWWIIPKLLGFVLLGIFRFVPWESSPLNHYFAGIFVYLSIEQANPEKKWKKMCLKNPENERFRGCSS